MPRASRIDIRPATERDLPALLEIERRCFTQDLFTEEKFRHYLQADESVLLVSEKRGEVVGCAVGELDVTKGTRTVWLDSIAVLPGMRRTGIATALLRRFENAALQQDASSVLLEVSVRNQAARKFYQEESYEVVDQVPEYYGPGHDAVVLHKSLRP